MVANDNCSACEFQNGLASSRRYDENRLERNRKPLGRRVQHSNGWRGGSEPNLFKHVGLEAREIPAVGEVFSLDFPLYRTCSSTWGWKQEKFQRWGKCFLLTSPSIEHPPRPQKKARIPTKPGLVSTRALSAGSCFIDRPCCAASPQASHRACPALRSCDKRTIPQTCALYPRSQEGSLTAHLVRKAHESPRKRESQSSSRDALAACSGSRARLELHFGMVHACHAPTAGGFLAHGHAPSAQPAACRIDGEFVLIPHRVAHGVERAFMNHEPRGGRLMKIALAEIARNFFTPVQF